MTVALKGVMAYITVSSLAVLCADEPLSIAVPDNVLLKQATYGKVSITWQIADTTAQQIAGYVIYRDNVNIASCSAQTYTDVSVQPGNIYTYKIAAVTVGGAQSEFSSELAVQTIGTIVLDGQNAIKNAVDTMHGMSAVELAGNQLLTQAKNTMGAELTMSIPSFTLLDEAILNEYFASALSASTETALQTEDERAAQRIELANILNEHFNSNSIEYVYVHKVLEDLAERHWRAGKTEAAFALYEMALKYLTNNPAEVYGILNRLAHLKLLTTSNANSNSERLTALDMAKDYYLSFFSFFPNSTEKYAIQAYRSAANMYFEAFPELLSYSDYNQAAFLSAKNLLEQAVTMNSSLLSSERFAERIAAWELVNMDFDFKDETGATRSGTLTISNISANTGLAGLFPKEPYTDQRIVPITSGIVTVPLYKGHVYKVEARFPTHGGADLVYDIPVFAHDPSGKYQYDYMAVPGTLPQIGNVESGNNAQTSFIIPQGNYPYNLRVEYKLDSFDLAWDWVAPAGFELKCFKVFRNNIEVATVTDNNALNLPLLHNDGIYNYNVVAYDITGVTSTSSPQILISPASQTQYSNYYAWLLENFGSLEIPSNGDYDNDGTSNYQEFLAGTDPTKAPGPVLSRAQRGYGVISFKWDSSALETADAVYELRRDDGVETTYISVAGHSYTERGLSAGEQLTYSLRLKNGTTVLTDWSCPIKYSTLTDNAFLLTNNLADTIDAKLPAVSTDDLINSLQNTLASSGVFLTNSRLPLDAYIAEKTAAMVTTQSFTPEQYSVFYESLQKFMEDYWQGEDYEKIQIYADLNVLAEKYFTDYLHDRTLSTYPAIAAALLNTSINFVRDNPIEVYSVLNRLAAMHMEELTPDSSATDIKIALAAQASERSRFADMFPAIERSNRQLNPYRASVNEYLKYCPYFLKYDSYDFAFYEEMASLVNTWFAWYPDELCRNAQNRVTGWALIELPVQVALPSGVAGNGELTVTNVTPHGEGFPILYSAGFPADSRIYQLSGELLTVRVYAGHLYNLELKLPVAGGDMWSHKLNNIHFANSGSMSFDGNIWSNENGDASISIPALTPQGPYNLAASHSGNGFVLSWSWTSPENYNFDHFNIYCHNTLLGTSLQTSFGPIDNTIRDGGVYDYKVTAVDSNGNESSTSPILTILPNFTEEQRLYYEWQKRYFGDNEILATGDDDGDGLTNYQEFQLGSDPTQAPPSNPLDNIDTMLPGAVVKYYAEAFIALPDFAGLEPYKTTIKTSIQQESTLGEVFDSERSNAVGVDIQGYFTAETDGYYRFFMENDDGATLSIDHGILINHGTPGWSDGYEELYLKKGIHSFHVVYYDRTEKAVLKITWAGPTFARKTIDSALWHTVDDAKLVNELSIWQKDTDFDGVTDIVERQKGTDIAKPDTDNDGLTDYEEIYLYTTNPLLPDSDNDGVNDYEEVKFAKSNPLVADFNGLSEIHQTISGNLGVPVQGSWGKSANHIYSIDRNGAVNYNINIPASGYYVLELTGGEKLLSSADSDFTIVVCANGIQVAERVLKSQNQADSTIRFYLPKLQQGDATFQIYWKNVSSNTSLRISELKLLSLNGPDSNSNNRADWLDHRLANLNNCNIPNSSQVSPICIEGMPNSYSSGRTISVSATNESVVKKPWSNGSDLVWAQTAPEGYTEVLPLVKLGVNASFYADVPLSSESSTDIAVANEDGDSIINHVTWQPTNIFAVDAITIRAGDALLLNGALGDSISGTSIITIGNEQYTLNPDQSIPVRFDNAGTYSVFAEFTPESGPSGSSELQVTVVGAAFSSTPFAVVGLERDWENPNIPQEAMLNYDNILTAYRINKADGCNIMFYGKQSGKAIIAARLGDDGPIMSTALINIVDCSTHKEDGYYKILEVFPDGDKMIEGKIVLNDIPEDIRIQLIIYTSGTTFLDGTVEKWLTADDFDENGVCRYQMIKSPDSPTSTCHSFNYYQGNQFLFSYRNW